MQPCILLVLVASLTASPPTYDGGGTWLLFGLVGVVLCEMLTVIAAWGIAARTIADVQCQHRTRSQILQRWQNGKRVHLILWIVVQVLVLTVFPWPLQDESTVTGLLLWDEFCGLLPMLVSLVASWTVQFDADRCVTTNQSTLTRQAYVLAKVRNGLLLPAVPIVILLGSADLFRVVAPQLSSGAATTVLPAIPLVLVVICFPLVLRTIWGARPLGDTELRIQLQRRADEAELPVRDILVWDTNLQAANAAMCGIISPFRFVFLTDRLIRDLAPRDIEMIFLHELAHAKLCHSMKLIVTLLVSMASGFLLSRQLPWLRFAGEPIAVLLPVGITFLLLGRYARLFELEADLWAASQSSKGPQAYLRALAQVSGSGDPARATWLHPAFALRCRLVQADPTQSRRWVRRQVGMTTISWITLGAAIAALAVNTPA